MPAPHEYGDLQQNHQATSPVVDNILRKLQESPMKTAIMYIMAFGSGMIWGITFSLARIATEAGKAPLGLAWWQAFGGGIVLLIYSILKSEFRRHRPRLGQMLFVGTCGNVIPGTLLFYAAIYVPAGVLAITIAIVPMLTYASGTALSLERFSWRRLAGVLLGFVAILLIMLPDGVKGLEAAQSGTLLTDTRFWIAASLFACCFYTLENLFVESRVSAEISIPVLLSGGMLVAAALLLPLVLLNKDFVTISLPLDKVDGSIIAMMFVSAVAYLMYLMLIKMAGAIFASMSGYVVTLAGVFWGIIIFSETHSPLIWAALALMLVGMALVTPRSQAKP